MLIKLMNESNNMILVNPDHIIRVHPYKMTTAICDRISHLEDAMAAGLQYVGRSCH